MKEQDYKKIFSAHKVEIPNEGFSDDVLRQLPKRNSIMSQLVMCIFIVIGVALTLILYGISPLLGQFESLIYAITHLQTPSPGAIITYIGIIGLIGIIGYSVANVDVT